MSGLARYYGSGDIEKFLKDVDKYSIGMDEWFHRFGALHQTEANYPPYNVIQENAVSYRVEVAVAGFATKELEVFTENNKLYVEGQKELAEPKEGESYVHRGVAARSFKRVWTISDDVEVKDVEVSNGLLTIRLSRIVPDHQKRRSYL
ncbi:Hsp20 heat shock protein [Synechococcus phage ACG-2014f]|jgi:molecular chaperone IbpA|uniref:Hsp20 heat shock protein n=5 Tax=Atlauavirus TaxID=2733092 RepID=A0A0E3F4S6_9CAUD|nr:Hsp20 heat shock protein [Synechococcus phage ACG-2014f]YP_009778316.1 Hsp20 heat shock protein [Synechococcus phage ACG-2014f_Syn7803C7]YP_009778604.1 Hsp20 heat shock protein [Synechococcus phage ACG-2014f_Syn7803C8]YP_009778882.1 Hsp20 heat shock protein [Synechococcus phage ACG-2014f_Syn7803US26]AIX16684.1 Hsp20 heat shock protein [Synechococcus phage ACG-2014f]AIX18462.1 Hsp20 heat shock protein [Synechococcus phage ACG-2014f]AIX20053.1 Hsp20 heat shock protein [Synechococcus phage AC